MIYFLYIIKVFDTFFFKKKMQEHDASLDIDNITHNIRESISESFKKLESKKAELFSDIQKEENENKIQNKQQLKSEIKRIKNTLDNYKLTETEKLDILQKEAEEDFKINQQNLLREHKRLLLEININYNAELKKRTDELFEQLKIVKETYYCNNEKYEKMTNDKIEIVEKKFGEYFKQFSIDIEKKDEDIQVESNNNKLKRRREDVESDLEDE